VEDSFRCWNMHLQGVPIVRCVSKEKNVIVLNFCIYIK
jgi:hypothetical protein